MSVLNILKVTPLELWCDYSYQNKFSHIDIDQYLWLRVIISVEFWRFDWVVLYDQSENSEWRMWRRRGRSRSSSKKPKKQALLWTLIIATCTWSANALLQSKRCRECFSLTACEETVVELHTNILITHWMWSHWSYHGPFSKRMSGLAISPTSFEDQHDGHWSYCTSQSAAAHNGGYTAATHIRESEALTAFLLCSNGLLTRSTEAWSGSIE